MAIHGMDKPQLNLHPPFAFCGYHGNITLSIYDIPQFYSTVKLKDISLFFFLPPQAIIRYSGYILMIFILRNPFLGICGSEHVYVILNYTSA